MKLLFLAFSLILPSPAWAQNGGSAPPEMPRPEIAGRNVQLDAFPQAQATFANGVRVLPEVRYAAPDGFRPLTLDIYLPPATLARPPTGFPAILYIHGGGWINGDSHISGPIVDFPGLLAGMAARGYVVTSVNYRLSGEAKWPAQAQDIKAAIRFLRRHAAQYGADPSRLAAWGVSAGGHLSAIADATCGAAPLQPPRSGASGGRDGDDADTTISDCVQAAVAWYGIFDVASEADQARRAGAMSRDAPGAPEWLLLGCFKEKCPPGLIQSASPVAYVNPDTPPMLLLTGDRDRTVPFEQTLEMDAALTKAGVKHETHVYSGADHSLLGPTLEATRQANQDAIERTIRFIDATIGTPRGSGAP